MLPPLSKVIVFLLLFTVPWGIFDKPFRRSLPLSCFYGSSQWLLKVRITCERVNINVCLWHFLLSQFSTFINLQPLCVESDSKICREKRWQFANCKLNDGCKLVPSVTVLATRNFTSPNVRAEPFYVHENQCTQMLNLSSSD